MPKVKTPKTCCPRFESELADGALLYFSADGKIFGYCPRGRSEVYIISDGGHGGAEHIDYCPFCGTKIEFEKV